MSLHLSLEAATNGVRLFSAALALAILAFWSPAVLRIVRGRYGDGDAHRAAWVPLALAVMTFELRWFWPGIQQLTKDRLALFAHCGMAMALMFAICVHGHRIGTLKLRRALLLHAAMLALSIGASGFLR